MICTCSDPAQSSYAVTLFGDHGVVEDCSFEAKHPSLGYTAFYNTGEGLRMNRVDVIAMAGSWGS